MYKLFSLFFLAVGLSAQSHAQSQNVFHIECIGITKTNNLTKPSENFSESENFSFAINSESGHFITNGKVFLGPTFDKAQPAYKFSIDESSYTYKHRYFNEGPDPLNSIKNTQTQLDTLIKLNRFTGQLEIIEQIRTSGGNNSLTIISGKYSCSKIKDRKF